jgi:hypothetical protein
MTAWAIKPDDGVPECAMVVEADVLITLDTAPGRFARKHYGRASVAEFIRIESAHPLMRKLLS